MGLNSAHAIGRERKFFAKAETTPGAWIEPVGTDAVKMLSSSFDWQQERSIREDSRQTRSPLERITQKGSVAWSCEGYLIPSGVAGTAPDAGAMLEAAWGIASNTPATREKYTLSNVQTPGTLTLLHHFSDVYQESIWGTWVDEFGLSIAGGESPKMSYSGGAMGFSWTGVGVELTGQTGTVFVPKSTAANADEERNFSVNSMIQIDTETGVVITAVDYDSPSHTMDDSITTAANDVVLPWAPVETTAGSPISSNLGSLVFGSTAAPITGLDFTCKNNFKSFDDEAFAQFPTDFVPLYREITGTVTLRARKDMLIYLSLRNTYQQKQLTVNMGTVAGSIVILDMPACEFDFSAVDLPTADEAIISLPFRAMATSAENEASLSFE